jgi:Luciferase-like monooxygenase
MGGPRRTVAEARQALSEAVDIIRASWAGEPFRYAGQHYQVPDAQPGPRPAHDVGIWLGVVGPRAVRLAGAKADGWSVSAPYVPPSRLAELGGILTESAREAGRDPDQIVRLYNVMGLITPTRPGSRGCRSRHVTASSNQTFSTTVACFTRPSNVVREGTSDRRACSSVSPSRQRLSSLRCSSRNTSNWARAGWSMASSADVAGGKT